MSIDVKSRGVGPMTAGRGDARKKKKKKKARVSEGDLGSKKPHGGGQKKLGGRKRETKRKDQLMGGRGAKQQNRRGARKLTTNQIGRPSIELLLTNGRKRVIVGQRKGEEKRTCQFEDTSPRTTGKESNQNQKSSPSKRGKEGRGTDGSGVEVTEGNHGGKYRQNEAKNKQSGSAKPASKCFGYGRAKRWSSARGRKRGRYGGKDDPERTDTLGHENRCHGEVTGRPL